MKENAVLRQLEARSFRIVGNNAYGQTGGYPVMITSNGRSFITAMTADRAPDRQDSREILKRLKEAGLKAAFNGRAVVLNLSLKKSEDADSLLGRLNAAASVLKTSGVRPPAGCAVCSRGGADSYIVRNDKRPVYDCVHRECINKLQADISAKTEENPGSYGMGVLGAAIGAIVGIIPAFIGIYFLNIISAWLFMLIPVATYFGYKRLGGKLDRAATACSIIFSLLGMGFLFLVLDVCLNMEYGNPLGMAIASTIQYTFVNYSADYWSWLSPNIGQMIMFYAIGLIFSLRIISRTHKAELNSVNRAFETVTSISSYNEGGYTANTEE